MLEETNYNNYQKMIVLQKQLEDINKEIEQKLEEWERLNSN